MRQLRLNDIYDEAKIRLSGMSAEFLAAFSPPLLIKIPDGWEEASRRVLWVGQETADWTWTKRALEANDMSWPYADQCTISDFATQSDSVAALVYGYGKFNFAENHRVRKSPFWKYFHRTGTEFSTSAATKMAWSNVIRCCAKLGNGYPLWTVPAVLRAEMLSWQFGLLSAEMRLLQPQVVIFACGPYYDLYLNQEFQGLEYLPVAKFPVRALAQVRHRTLPDLSFRTYHPGFLNRSSLGFNPVQAIVDAVAH